MDLGKDLYDVREAVGLAGRRAGEWMDESLTRTYLST
jgi:hypothetical protein